MKLGRHNFRKNTADNDLRMCSCFNRKRPILCSDLFLLFRTDVEKLEANQMIVEVDQGVAYVQFEKKLNIRSHIQYIATLWPKKWSLRKGMTGYLSRNILLRWPTNIQLNWQVCIRSSGLLVYWFHRGKFGKRATCWIFSTPSTLLATIQISRVLNTHPPRLWIDVPNSFPWRKCLRSWSKQVVSSRPSQVSTRWSPKAAALRKRRRRPRSLCSPLCRFPFYSPFDTIWKLIHTHSWQDSKVKFSLHVSSIGKKRVCMEAGLEGWLVTRDKCNESVFWRCCIFNYVYISQFCEDWGTRFFPGGQVMDSCD